MIPRFSNPHILETSTKLASRADLQDSDLGQDDQIDTANEDIPVLTKRLRELVQDDLGNVTFTTTEGNSRRKRRKLENTSNDVKQETPILFRLVSSSLVPHELYLAPKPPPPVRSIEPEYEDNAAQAKQRAQRAHSVAVDYEWVSLESNKSYFFLQNDQRKIICGKISSRLSEQLPALFVVERPQSPRNTRPPVPVASHLSAVMAPAPATSSDHPMIPIEFPGDPTNAHRARSRRQRRRQKSVVKERPQPTFWRPDPAVRGKSLGYALGYPGSWAAYKPGSRRYERDTMRKGVHVDAVY